MRIAMEDPEQLKDEQTMKLCIAYGGNGGQQVLSELERRGAIRSQFAEAVQRSQVQIGMQPCEVIAAWQSPENVNRTTTANETAEQWVYNHTAYVYFTGGHVTSIQD
jgi:hypothetical protein